MAEGSRMGATSLLTIMFLLPLLSAAPLDIAGEIMDDNDGMHSHDENVTRRGKFFGHNRFDMGDMNISGSVVGDVVSIGHQVKIDVHGHTQDHHHHEADTAVDGGWSNWSEYGQCSKSCGGGHQTRTRTCTNPVPQHKGRTCEQQNIGDPTETKGCEDTCPAVWSPVCGVDGKTYSNTCKACGIEVACDGLCPCNAKFPCEFDDGLLSPQVLEGGQLSPYDTSQLFKWENNVITYYYTNQKTRDGDKALVRSVMDRFEDYTCFTFIEEDEDVYGNKHQVGIDIEDVSCRGGIQGYVMKAPYREQKLLLKLTAHVTNEDGEDECGTVGLIIHELMHVVGVGHTQRRNDRDNFIRVNFENLDGAKKLIKDQYKKCQDCKLFDRIPYDCGSIMHYGTHFEGKEVIEPKDKETCTLKKGPLLYRVWNAPAKDWELLNIIGNCSKEPTSVQAAPANINYATEMPNIGQLFQGYDIMKGNPLSVDPFPVDPGFRQPIFEAIYSGSLTADRRYRQPDGTTISSCKDTCALKFSSTEISGSKSYQESLARKVGLSVGGSIGVWGGKFSASYGYKEVAEKTSSDSKLFTLASSSCCAYSTELLSYELPSLSQNFRSGVQTLTEKYDEIIYFNFIKAFGTHFIKKARMGSLYAKQSEILKSDWTNMMEKGIDIGIAAELSAYEVTASSDVSQTDNVNNAEIFASKAKKQTVVTKGVKPPTDGKEGIWRQKTISDPAPIQLTLGGSVLDLLEHDDIKAKVSTAVKTNLKKALDDYCGLLLKSGEAKTCSSPGPDPPVICPHKDDLTDVLLENNWGTKNQIFAMSEDDQRKTVIAEVEKMTGHTIEDLQERANAGDFGSLTAIANMAAILIKYSIRSSSDVKTMTYEPHLRNTLIIETSKRFSVGTLQHKTDRQLLNRFCAFYTVEDTLYKGQKLETGEFLRSDNGDYEFLIQDDGNMIIYQISNPNKNARTWASNTKVGPGSVSEFIFQKDGNLVLYNNAENIWESRTSTKQLLIEKTTADALVMKNDGILVLQTTTGDILWDSKPGYIETPGIKLDALTFIGEWGEVQKCSYPHFVNKMDLKYAHVRLNFFRKYDDTGLNAIRLTCTDGLQISSTEGPWGNWFLGTTCPKGEYINTARIRSEAYELFTDNKFLKDNTAANGIRFKCTGGSEHAPQDGEYGSWTPWKSCEDGSAIYGIQTLVEAPIKNDGTQLDDDTALNNVKFLCAKLPNRG